MREQREGAAARARELLVSFLTKPQRREFAKHKAVTIIGASGQVYRITYGKIANIEVLAPGGRLLHRLCVHPENPELPVEDVMLSQLLHLRADEDVLVRRANIHHVGLGWRPQ